VTNPVIVDPATCRHAHTQLIAKDSDAEYVECLDCGAILESGERPEPTGKPETSSEPEPSAGFDESLGDA
jgi:hypothetical protein